MRRTRESLIVLIIVILVFGINLIYTLQNRIELVTVEPDKPTLLSQEDFRIDIGTQSIYPGQSTLNDVMAILPSGHTLGMSTVYRIDNMNLLFTFSKKESILNKIDIADEKIHTARGLGVGDSKDQVEEKYGNGYTLVYDRSHPEEQELIYGQDHFMVFKMKQDKVDKIVIDYPLTQ